MTHRLTSAVVGLAAAYAWVVVALLAFGIVSGIETGFVAIAQIMTPHLALASLALLPLAALRGAGELRLGLILVLILFAARFGAEWLSLPPAGAAAGAPDAELRVATWNLEANSRGGADSVAFLRDHPSDLIALQELTPSVAAAIERDVVLTDRYPYRHLDHREGVIGVGFLSRYPLTASPMELAPIRQEARLAHPAGEIVVINAHPFPADAGFFRNAPFSFDPSTRNTYHQLLRDRVAALEAAGEAVLLIGDFNTGPTEPAFPRLTAGLHDAHAEVGIGPGWTWRPARFAFLGIGLLRIDLVLSTAGLRPLSTSVACAPRGDHCLVEATLSIAAP